MSFYSRATFFTSIFSFFCLVGFSFPNSFAASVVVKQLAPGITYTQETTPTLIINIVTADRDTPGVRIEAAIARDSITAGSGDPNMGRDLVRSTARRRHAVAAINGDYFGYTGDPLGFGIASGEIYSEPWTTPRAAFGLIPNRKAALFDVLAYQGDLVSKSGSCSVNAIDRPVTKANRNDVVVYTQLYGAVTGGRPGCAEVLISGVDLPLSPGKTLSGLVESVNPGIKAASPIPDDSIVISAAPTGKGYEFLKNIKVGETVQYTPQVAPKNEIQSASNSNFIENPSETCEANTPKAKDWSLVQNAIAGGPMLLVNGKIAIDGASEGFEDGLTNGAHARTAVGQMSDGKIIFATVEGLPGKSSGVSLNTLAQILLRYGVVNAINLDGGGSTTMAVNGVTVNYPSQGLGERKVADMLLLFGDSPSDSSDDLSIAPPSTPLKVGETYKIPALLENREVLGSDNRIIWSGPATSGIGYTTQDGIFNAVRAGSGVVSALIGDKTVSVPILVQGTNAGENGLNITAKLVGDNPGADSCELSIQLTQKSGLPKSGAKISISVTGGSSAQSSLATNEDGLAKTTINWTADNGKITITTEGLPPTVLMRNQQPHQNQ